MIWTSSDTNRKEKVTKEKKQFIHIAYSFSEVLIYSFTIGSLKQYSLVQSIRLKGRFYYIINIIQSTTKDTYDPPFYV